MRPRFEKVTGNPLVFITEIEKSSISNTIDINILENPSEAELVSNVVCKSSCCYTVTNQLEIVGAVNLVANTDDGCTISAHDDTRIFKIETTGVLTVIHVRINHGRSEKGGALINDGQFHGTNLIFNDNRASIISLIVKSNISLNININIECPPKGVSRS